LVSPLKDAPDQGPPPGSFFQPFRSGLFQGSEPFLKGFSGGLKAG
jgi:hypothetical protein